MRLIAPPFAEREIENGNEELVDQTGASWNQVLIWLRNIDVLRTAA